jgi:Phospholipase_D-nuclease N-terminal
MLALLGSSELIFLAVFIPLVLASFAFWIWMLVDCVRNRALSDNERIIWVIVICVTQWLGALIYLFAGRRGSGGGVQNAPGR